MGGNRSVESISKTSNMTVISALFLLRYREEQLEPHKKTFQDTPFQHSSPKDATIPQPDSKPQNQSLPEFNGSASNQTHAHTFTLYNGTRTMTNM
eukprot:747859-Amphidinium_carterae.1